MKNALDEIYIPVVPPPKQNLHFCFLCLYCGPIRLVGIESARQVLARDGFRTSQIFFGKHYIRNNSIAPTPEEIKLLIDKFLQINPDLIIMSVTPLAFWISKDITRQVKVHLKTPILWGGLQPTVSPDECIQIADMICIDEGEEAILELAQKMSAGDDIDHIHNLWVRRGNEIIKNSPRRLLEDLDWIPPVDYRQGEIYYVNSEDIKEENEKTNTYTIMTSRGCPFKCSFCCTHVYQHYHKGKIRFRTVENVINNIYEAKKIFYIKEISFTDDVFAVNLEWTRNFCREYKQKISLPFFCYLHPLTINKEKLDLLLEAGLNHVDMGIQSGSPRVRREIFEREESNEDILKAACLINESKLSVTYDLIVDNPFENKNNKKETLDLLLRLPGTFNLRLYPLYFFPGSKLTEKALNEGLILEKDIAGHEPGKIVRELTDNYNYSDYHGGRQELSWYILLKSFNIYYYGIRLYPKWILGLIGNSYFLDGHPAAIRRLLVFVGFWHKIFIYLKKNGI